MKVCSIFSQVLKLFSRGGFEKAVKQHKAERHARGFTSWGQFMAMLFCQVGRAHSLREICGGLACCEGQLKHLGVPVAPKRSTLAYANEHRPWELYQTVFEQTLSQCQELVRIRNICEVIVEQELLQGVTQRYQPNVMMTKLPKINFTGLEAAVSAINPIFEDCCRYIGSHSQSLRSRSLSRRP
jgi:hypothetical protein